MLALGCSASWVPRSDFERLVGICCIGFSVESRYQARSLAVAGLDGRNGVVKLDISKGEQRQEMAGVVFP